MRILAVALLMMVSMGAKADIDVKIGTFTGGKITATQETVDSKVTVTLTVTPDKANGYKIKKNDIYVYATLSSSPGNTRMDGDPEISDRLELDGKDPSDLSAERTYTVTVSDKFGIWVKEANFDNSSKGGRSLPFVVTTEEDLNDNKPKYYLIQSVDRLGFYAIPYTNAADSKVSTTSIPHEMMRWYFMDAGSDDDHQYYYIVNSTGRCLYWKSGNDSHDGITINKTYAEMSSSAQAEQDKYKFFLTETGSNFFIQPKSSSNYYLNKRGGNIRGNDTNYFIKASTWNDSPSVWNFVAVADVSWPQPFSVSTGSDKYYYKIQNKKYTSYYLSTLEDSGNEWATIKSGDSNKSIWCLVDAGTYAPFSNCHYYYIVNVLTNKYLYYTKGTGNDIAKIMDYDASKADNFKFLIVDAACKPDNSNYVTCYSIVPKLRQANYLEKNCFSPIAESDDSHMLLKKDRDGASYLNYEGHWDFVETPFSCGSPVISFDNTTNEVTMESETDGASIYYTTDESVPDPDHVGEGYPTQLYDSSNRPTISEQITIKAIAIIAGMPNSEVVTMTIYKVGTPTIVHDADLNAIKITTTTEGATIRYTTASAEGSLAIPTTTTGSTCSSGEILQDGVSNKYIKAIAVKEGCITSEVSDLFGPVMLKCANPMIQKNENGTYTVICTVPSTGVTIYYTINGDDPTTSSDTWEIGTSKSLDLGTTIKVMATATDYENSSIVTKKILDGFPSGDGSAENPYQISDADFFNVFAENVNSDGQAGKYYQVTEDIDISYCIKIEADFNGILDGGYKILTGLDHPLFISINDGTVRNVILDEVSINTSGNAGAIAATANGATRIYNCGILSGSVGGSDNVGGLVGYLNGEARVINCYSYANITGGSVVGGIVGNNSVSTTSSNLKTMVMNCMFYGDISGSTNKAPIYNGNIIPNVGSTGVGNYNYFAADATYVQNNDIQKYNCALMAETRFLQRFEFYRYLLNSHRELAAWWATGDRGNKDLMAKWVLDPSQIGSEHPYPILKAPKDAEGHYNQYPSVVNIDAKNATTTSDRNKGGKLGELTVYVRMGDGEHFTRPAGAEIISGISPLTLNITDKDYDHFNFNYYKVQLPYYNNVGTNNYTGNRVVTGWKIVSITGGTPGSFTTGVYDAEVDDNGNITSAPYNFADRYCTNKDLYSVSGRVFNQGAYWDVPEGVESITIEPYWAKAAYVADAYADVVYNTGMTTPYNVANVGGGEIYTNGVSTFNGDDNQIVYTNTLKDDGTINNTAIANALSVLSPNSNHTVNDYAVVLVGNYHQYGNIESGNKPYTVTSVDLDHDNEPDYSFILRFNGRTKFHAVKYDFLNLVGLGMAQKSTGSKGSYNFGIPSPLNWFEVTNTALFRVTQMEYSPTDRAKKPIIMQGGVIEQWVTQQQDAGDAVEYFHVGGNVWFKEFHRGSHQDNDNRYTTHPPLSVTGGDYEKFYLTGAYQPLAKNYNDDAECYINGGRFGTMAGAGMEGIGDASTHTKGNIIWQIDNADINEFFGGGLNGENSIQGNITTIIRNSHVGLFCGGPKFGDMNSGRTVKTTATDCHFGTYFGAGYGGNSYYRAAPMNFSSKDNDPWKSDDKGYNLVWNDWVAGRIKASKNNGTYPGNIPYTGYNQDYIGAFGGVSVGIDYQFIPMSDNDNNVARLFLDFVSFSLATTHNVTSKLTGCTITGNFYGGGSLGAVNGPVTSTLTNCQVDGSVFGAGYSASLPTVSVMPTTGFKVEPNYDTNTGVFMPGELPDYEPVAYHWEHAGTVNSTATAIDKENHILYTEKNLTALGTVTGNVTLNIEGTTTVAGSVYGGGEESGVVGDTEVNVTGGTIGYADAPAYGALVGNVYGGGKGLADKVDAGLVTGNTNINIIGTAETPFIYHNIYGGGAYGSVGTFTYDANKKIIDYTSGGTCTVTITGGKIGTNGKENGMVFGSSRGDVSTPVNGVDPNDYLAWVHDTHVIIGTANSTELTYPQINGSVYGSGENGHTFTNTVVDIHSGTIGIKEGETITDDGGTPNDPSDDVTYSGPRYPNRGNVYGGGCGTDTYDAGGKTYYNLNAGIVLGNCTVNIDGGHVVRNVYGAGAMGSAGTFTLLNYTTHADYHTEHPQVPEGKPYLCAENTGKCEVNVSGGMIGALGASMKAEGGPDDYGHVFGAGRGEVQDSTVYANMRLVGYVNETDVRISDNAFITGSVYGGSESGHVLGNTSVTVSGGQIGCAYDMVNQEAIENPYTNEDFTNAFDEAGNVANPLHECAHWDYDTHNSPYDRFSDQYENLDAAKGGRKIATDGHSFYGNVFGGGSGYYPYAPGKWVRSAGLVEGNTEVIISGGHILSSVYGGNEHTDVNGSCTVNMTGGTVGVPRTWSQRRTQPVLGNVFGAGKGDKRVLFNTWTNVASTTVTISGGTVYGSVFGGGEDGHVLGDATTTISGASTVIGTLGTTGYDGNVFGGGRGSYTALTAGAVCGNVSLNIDGGYIKGSVYGGGRLASVGTHLVPPTTTGASQTEHKYYGKEISDGKKQVIWKYLDDNTGNDDDDDASGLTHGHVSITITGGTIGAVQTDGRAMTSQFSIGDVFGGCKGTTNGEYSNAMQYDEYNNPVQQAQTRLGISKSALVNMLGGTVHGSIYGGGEVGNVGEIGIVDNQGNTKVNFVKVNLLGGTVGNVYGGGLGMKANVNGATESAEALVKSDVKVNLNGLEPEDYDSDIHGTLVTGRNEDKNEGDDFYRVADDAGCVVTGTIFGCNNLNGTPQGHAKVHVFKTQPKEGQAEGAYDVAAVYGGGNQADYVPTATDTQQKTEVIIEGCGLTSIQQVYGGGNAAATPGTLVTIKGTELIDEVFGGGNGVSTADFTNPGANVGILTGTETSYTLGDGVALVRLMAGNIHYAYGGSNTKGDIRGGSSVETVDNEWIENVSTACCKELHVDEMYGGGKNAGMKSGTNIILGCSNSTNWVNEIYAGAENADVEGDCSLTITSGMFKRVFGGNKFSGKLKGSIVVNIEENGQCGIPVIIGELYGGGNKAPYSVYGYDNNGRMLTSGTPKYNDPVVNVRAFTSIGNIYGGGYGADAILYGNTNVNINETLNHQADAESFSGNEYEGYNLHLVTTLEEVDVKLYPHEDGAIGVIGNVFGGGNAAAVYGNTNVNIGTTTEEPLQQLDNNGNPLYEDVVVEGVTKKQPKKIMTPVVGADIRGNVYGGGNEAIVTGNTNVNIGKEGIATP